MRPMPELMIEELPVDELVPYAKNAKIHTTEQVQQIANSISEFGFNDPVGVWDSPDGLEIVEGHGRAEGRDDGARIRQADQKRAAPNDEAREPLRIPDHEQHEARRDRPRRVRRERDERRRVRADG